MFLTYQYNLRPTRAQHRALEGILEGQRILYNAALEERIGAWRHARKSLSYIDQTKSLTTIRAEDPLGYGALPAKLSRWPLKKADEAFKAFFRRIEARKGKAGFPRFRSKAGWISFGFTEFSGIRLINGRLYFDGLIGGLRIHMHRPLPAAPIKCCVLTKIDRGWRIAFQIDVPEANAVRTDEPIGLDWGVENLATLSTGEVIPNPRFGKEAASAMRTASRKLARAERKSNRREKAKVRLARLRRKLANRRKTYLHQASADLTRRFGAIAVEDLQIAEMTTSAGKYVRQKAGLNREILDTGPGMLIAMLRYKAARSGSRFAAVNARNTSQTCSGCDAVVRKDLSIRIHKCTHCKMEIHRDINAARNILKRAVAGPWSGFAAHLPNVPDWARIAPEPSVRPETLPRMERGKEDLARGVATCPPPGSPNS